MRTTARLDTREVDRSFAALHKRAHALPQAFASIKKAARIDTREHVAKREGPAGSWPERSGATIAKLRANGRRARRIMGKLPTAVTYTSTAHGMRAESRVPWSGAHQEGGRIGRGALLPARPFLWISDNLLEKAVAIIQRALLEVFGRA